MSSDPDAPADFVLTDAGRRELAAYRQRLAERYSIVTATGWTELWCAEHASNGSDFLGEWEGSAEQHAAAILAARLQHERDQH